MKFFIIVSFIFSITAAFTRLSTAEPGAPMEIKDRIIAKLNLEPLPGEGGYFRRTYESMGKLEPRGLGIQGSRHLGTAIYYLVTPESFSALHRLKADEIFHFYVGDPVEMLQISPAGEAKKTIIGPDVLGDQQPQVVVPAGNWQGTKLLSGGKWALLGTTMSPGFDEADFELGDRSWLSELFPTHAELIKQFTRED